MLEVNFEKIEKKWQKRWEDARVFEAKDVSKKPKYYVLEMFPYPSGSGLHIGHALNYTIGDIFARFKRLQGFNVLHPIGYDALGLPAENAAIVEGTPPEKYTRDSTKRFMIQQKKMGWSYDWSRLVNTSDSSYYKWDQWIFLKMFEKGLAYKKESNVNWCPKCKTVLANEQAQNGRCDRCGSSVKIKYLNQWFLKITDYADELYEGIEKLNGWPERTKSMQRNWIGKSHGVEINFEIGGKKWPVFTTRPDTLLGVTFMVVSAKHPKLMDLVIKKQKMEVDKFLDRINSVSEKDAANLEKEGVFTGSYAINPINNEKVPIYVGNFVVADYGSGMVMAVPAHDKRDFEFAKRYKLKIKEVVRGGDVSKEAYVGEGKLINSGEFNGLGSKKAIEEITKSLIKKKLGKKTINFRLRDWGISRQRYWGTPIPIVYCKDCGTVPVQEKDLPVKLPKEVKFGKGNPLETNEKWIKVKCPKCGGSGRRETDTMDTFVNSSWYFLRYCDPKNDVSIFKKEKVKKWCPIDQYLGGAEHSCMHLIYFRFYTKFLRDLGLVDFGEPVKKLFHQGMLHGEDGEKMSKSKGNVVDPLDVVKKYGVDATRFFLVSVASPDKDFDWSEKGIQGSFKFIKRISECLSKLKIGKSSEKIDSALNKTIKNVLNYYSSFKFRKATIEIRGFFDLISKEKEISKETLGSFLKLISPICPHVAEELWEKIGNKEFISISEWPKFKKVSLKKIKKDVDINLKVVKKVVEMIKSLEGRGKEIKKVYLYILPFEFEKFNVNKLKKGLGKEVFIYSVKDFPKHDPKNKSKKARPGLPGVWFE